MPVILARAILASMLPLIFWQQYLSHRRSYVTVTSHFSTNILRLRRWRWPAFGAIATFGTPRRAANSALIAVRVADDGGVLGM